MADAGTVRVEVVAAWPDRVFRRQLALPEGATVGDAIAASGIRTAESALDLEEGRVGIFARKATFATRLREGDRVEVYRPLMVDPKEARRRRATKAAHVRDTRGSGQRAGR